MTDDPELPSVIELITAETGYLAPRIPDEGRVRCPCY
jgi:hypothetical protein